MRQASPNFNDLIFDLLVTHLSLESGCPIQNNRNRCAHRAQTAYRNEKPLP